MRGFWIGLLAAPVALSMIGCGGSSGGSNGSTPAVKDGGLVLQAAREPNGDLTLAQVQALPAGTRVAVALDRNNSAPEMYPATVKGFDAIDNVIWVSLDDSVTTDVAEGDSGSVIFTLPNSFRSGDSRNQKRIGSLSFGSADNLRDFFGTPISEIRATGVVPQGTAATPGARPSQLRPLATALTCRGIPASIVARIKQRANPASLLRNLVPMSGAAITRPSAPGAGTPNPLKNNSIATFMVRGDVVVSGAVGSVTASDNGGFVGYGHPFQGAGSVSLATIPCTVQGIFLSPLLGTYKLANPIGIPTMTMTFDGLNGVRFSNQAPTEVSLVTQLVDSSGTPLKTASHQLGFDGIIGDQALLLTSTVESSILSFYDQSIDLNGSATVTVTTILNGVSTSATFNISPRTGIMFGFDPNDPNFEILDQDIFNVMSTVEASGDLGASVTVTAQITLQGSSSPSTRAKATRPRGR